MALSPVASRKAFTLVELLVVVAIIALLAGLIIVAVGGARNAAQDTMERSRLRGLATASAAYAESGKGRLPSPRTETPPGWNAMTARPADCSGGNGGLREELAMASDPAQVRYAGWICADNARCPNAVVDNERETETAIENGSLFPYAGGLESFRSPLDPTGRLRSFSMNAWVGVLYCNDDPSLLPALTGGDRPTSCSLAYDARTSARILMPSDTALFLCEADPARRRGGAAPGWNLDGMLINPNPGSVQQPVNAEWFSVPAVWRPGQTSFNIAFVDGSTSGLRIESPEVRNGELSDRILREAGPHAIGSDDSSMADLIGLSRHALPGLLTDAPRRN